MGLQRLLRPSLLAITCIIFFSLSKVLADTPEYCIRQHNIGKLVFGVTNFGFMGRPPARDCFTNEKILLTEFPKGSNTIHLYRAGLWVGAVVGRDTLVSTATEQNSRLREFNPDVPPFGDIVFRSNIDPDLPDYDMAISEQDFISIYTDTFTTGVPDLGFDAVDFRGHRPLGIEVTQSSYAWSYSYTEDFVLFNYTIKNIGDKLLKDAYIGIYMDADVHEASNNASLPVLDPFSPFKPPTGGSDDLTGFVRNYKRSEGVCDITYNLNLAWTADNDGDSEGPNWLAPNAIGMRYLGRPNKFQLSYNWWIFEASGTYDFGPQHKNQVRNLGNGFGSPIGDRNKYFLLSNSEQDYDQAYASSISIFNSTWVRPDPRRSLIWSSANDNHWLLSIGPYDLQPGAAIDFPIGYIGGQQFQTNARAWRTYQAMLNDPERYYTYLDFEDLANNAIWAGWVYDNPGVDTDGDGYSGIFNLCILDSALVDSVWVPSVVETTYYEGDGVADWRGASPPPAPRVWVSPAVNGLKVRFNGERSETTKDIFSGIIDFEGYNVYIGRDNRDHSFSMVATYDRENYRKFVYNVKLIPTPGYVMEISTPYTLEELRCLYGNFLDPCNDSIFDPLVFTANTPYVHPFYPDSIFYFTRHAANASTFGVTTPIRKIYPNQPLPSLPPIPSDFTDDGYFKFYEYEFEINSLLPTIPYYMNVTAFDFGSPETGLDPLETSKSLGAIDAYTASSAEALAGEYHQVFVYPNPYRIDQNYRQRGFEGLTDDFLPDDKVRAIHFGNLPPRCTIRVFSLDGDLIRELTHDVPSGDPTSTHAQWDLITRNRQIVVSGLYYWCVEFPDGSTQIGKLAILF